jgi:hypothetical protein
MNKDNEQIKLYEKEENRRGDICAVVVVLL